MAEANKKRENGRQEFCSRQRFCDITFALTASETLDDYRAVLCNFHELRKDEAEHPEPIIGYKVPPAKLNAIIGNLEHATRWPTYAILANAKIEAQKIVKSWI